MGSVFSSPSKDWTSMSDKALVQWAKAGKDDAFEELMRRSWDQSLGLALFHLRNREDAIDEVQAAYWKAYTHLSTFKGEAKFSTWVGRIVINRCIMRLRSYKRTRALSFDHMAGVLEGPHLRDTRCSCDPEEQLGSREVSNLVQKELRCIPKLLRRAVELRHMHHLPLNEIGSQLGINIGAVKTRISRGNKYLRDRMVRHLGQRGVASLSN